MKSRSSISAILALLLSFAGSTAAHATTRDVACTSGTYHVTGTVADSSSHCIGEVIFDNTITEIGPNAFDNFRYGANSHDDITSITFGSSVALIGDHAFRYSTGTMTSLAIPNSVTDIGNGAFVNFNNPPSLLTSVTFGNHVVSIGEQAFASNPALQTAILPSSLTWVGPNAFADSAITSLRIPALMHNVPTNSFSWMQSLTSIYFEDGVTVISENAFNADEQISSIRLSATLTEIEPNAFASAHMLTEIRIPNSVETIGDEAFANSPNIASIYIGTGLRWLGSYVFSSDTAPGPSALQCLTNNSQITAQALFDGGIELAVPACAEPTPPGPAAYTGPIITGRLAKIASTSGGSEFTLNGERLAQVTLVTIDGQSLNIVSKSESQLVVKVPAHAAGFIDLKLKSDLGTLTFQDAFEFKTPIVVQVQKTKELAIPTGATSSLSVAQRTGVDSFVRLAGSGAVLTCSATHASKFDLQKAIALAQAACARAKKSNSGLITRISAPVLVNLKNASKILLSLKG